VFRRLVSVAGVLTILLGLAAMGPAQAKPLSDRQWRKQATAVCEQFRADRLGILPASGLSVVGHPDQARQYVDQAVPLYEDLITSIDSLDEPKARKKKVAAFVSALTAAIATIQENPLAAFSAFDDPFADANRAAKGLRLASCTGLGDQRL
jgi:hypothetical protein